MCKCNCCKCCDCNQKKEVVNHVCIPAYGSTAPYCVICGKPMWSSPIGYTGTAIFQPYVTTSDPILFNSYST